ncbi:hypothetical protein D3C74_443560 [compost metagenome]
MNVPRHTNRFDGGKSILRRQIAAGRLHIQCPRNPLGPDISVDNRNLHTFLRIGYINHAVIRLNAEVTAAPLRRNLAVL